MAGTSEIKQTINYGEHRNRWLNELKRMFFDTNKSEAVNYEYVLTLYCMLQNYGIYSNDDPKTIIKYFEANQKDFMERLKFYLSDIENRRKIYIAYRTILDCIQKHVNNFGTNSYYADFMDDLNVELGLMVGSKYNNFIPPNFYDDTENAFKYFLDIINIFRTKKGLEPFTEQGLLSIKKEEPITNIEVVRIDTLAKETLFDKTDYENKAETQKNIEAGKRVLQQLKELNQ